MKGPLRAAITGLVLSGVSGFVMPAIAGAQAQDEPAASRVNRVRALDATLAGLIRDAVARSATLKSLIDEIETTDGLVYVERRRCRTNVRACLVFPEAATGQTRVLRILIDERKSDREAMISLGHELQHALEVLREPTVRSGAAMHHFYHREARRLGDAFETNEAIAAGDAVRSELARRPGD